MWIDGIAAHADRQRPRQVAARRRVPHPTPRKRRAGLLTSLACDRPQWPVTGWPPPSCPGHWVTDRSSLAPLLAARGDRRGGTVGDVRTQEELDAAIAESDQPYCVGDGSFTVNG